jgi:hypothetical protein
MQAAYCQAKSSERRLLNQAFFERIEIADEEGVGYKLAAPFDQLKGGAPSEAEAEKAPVELLGVGWNETVAPVESRSVEPFSGTRGARTPDLSFEAEGSDVENLVRLRGVEPPRVFPPTRPSTLRVYQFRHSRLRGRRF